MKQSPNRLGNKEYDNIVDYISDLTNKGTEYVVKLREDWFINCFKQAGLDVDGMFKTIEIATKVAGVTEPEKIQAITEGAIQKFYEDNNIRLMMHPNFPDKEYLMMGDTPIGIWSNNIGIAVEGEKLKFTVEKWGDSK